MSGRTFPIFGEPGVTVPWEVVEPLRYVAHRVYGQPLERLAERGGLARVELAGLKRCGRLLDRARTERIGTLRKDAFSLIEQAQAHLLPEEDQ